MDEHVEPRWVEPHAATALGERYDALVAQSASAELRFDRGFRTRLFNLADGGWLSLTDLDDDFHSMRTALRISADGTIAEAAGRMLRNPYDTCPRALESLAGLVGANVARPSAHRQIKDRIPRSEGCLHIADMLTIAFRAFRISRGHDLPTGYGGEVTRRILLNLMPSIRDTCLSFAVDHAQPPR